MVVASKVKAKKESQNLAALSSASKKVRRITPWLKLNNRTESTLIVESPGWYLHDFLCLF
jgi:hypothetical protein